MKINVKELHRLYVSNLEWIPQFKVANNIEERLKAMLDLLPHGSGIDMGMELMTQYCVKNRELVFRLPYQHLSEYGYYTGWTTYMVYVIATFDGFTISIKVEGTEQETEVVELTIEYLYDLMAETFE